MPPGLATTNSARVSGRGTLTFGQCGSNPGRMSILIVQAVLLLGSVVSVQAEAWDTCRLGSKSPAASISSCSDLLIDLESYPKAKASLLHSRALAYSSIGRLGEALEDLDSSIKLDPSSPFSFQDRAPIHMGLKNFDGAIEDYTEAILLDPNRAFRFHDRGKAFVAAGNPAKAVSDFNRAIELSPRPAFRYYDRAMAFRDLGQVGRA